MPDKMNTAAGLATDASGLIECAISRLDAVRRFVTGFVESQEKVASAKELVGPTAAYNANQNSGDAMLMIDGLNAIGSFLSDALANINECASVLED